jgi:Peptidase family M1 domain
MCGRPPPSKERNYNPRVKRTFVPLLLAMASATPLAQQASAPPQLSPRNANYTISARLDPTAKVVTGDETIDWKNVTRATAPDLQFHLYYNAWRDARSTWMRERRLAGGGGPAKIAEDDRGWAEVDALELLDPSGRAIDLKHAATFIAPDDGNSDDRTVMRVPLPSPVPPGGSARVRVRWRSHVPRTFARTGALGNYFFVAQWFPKLGVLQDTGWNCHQFHAATEFFSDFGVYDVRLTVPEKWIVGATGVERGTSTHNNETTHRFVQEDVHDFAWTTSPDFREYTARFDHPTLPPVTMRLLLQPEHDGQQQRHFDATRTTLRYYGEWYGPYPYGHITIVDPAWQSGTGGMEYPTLFTAGSRWIVPEKVASPEGVTVHEAGHQFWYGIVANNEFEDAWMDEGFNTFSTARAIDQAYPINYASGRFFGGFIPWVYYDIPLSRAIDGNRLVGYRMAAKSDAESTPTFRYWPGTAGAITYNKTALWLNTLERLLGWDVMQKIMSTYFHRWAFHHPKPDDFFAVVNEVSGRDMTWFFDQVYRSSNVFDYGVERLTSERDPATDRFVTNVVVRRYGEALFPVDVLTTFEDGSTVREHWDGQARWKLYRYDRTSRARQAQVDPERVLLLDVNYTNNSRTLQPHTGEAATRWMLSWIVWAQDLLMTYGFFA